MNSQLAEQNSEAGILTRLIQARQGNLTRDAADYLLSLRFDDHDVCRLNELSELARQGNSHRKTRRNWTVIFTGAICSP